jgi:hypothetical protein
MRLYVDQRASLPYFEEVKDRNMVKKLIYNNVDPIPASGINHITAITIPRSRWSSRQ